MIKTSSYRQALVESLADPVEAKNYLAAVLEDHPQGFLKALRNVAQANQMSKVAKAAGVKRESLYRALSEQGNPTLDTLTGVLSALGLKLSITSENADKPSAPILSLNGIQQQQMPVVVSKLPALDFDVLASQTQQFGPLGVSVPTCTQQTLSHNIQSLWSTGGEHGYNN